MLSYNIRDECCMALTHHPSQQTMFILPNIVFTRWKSLYTPPCTSVHYLLLSNTQKVTEQRVLYYKLLKKFVILCCKNVVIFIVIYSHCILGQVQALLTTTLGIPRPPDTDKTTHYKPQQRRISTFDLLDLNRAIGRSSAAATQHCGTCYVTVII